MTESRSHDEHQQDHGRRCRVRVSSTEGILAVVPRLLGFHPHDSLVVLGIGGSHDQIRVAFRYDLPRQPGLAHEPSAEQEAADIAEHAAEVLTRQKLPAAIAIGYGPATSVTPVARALIAALLDRGIGIQDAFRVQDGRYWS